MIHERRKECFDRDLAWDTNTIKRQSGGNGICWWYIEVFAVKLVRDELIQSMINSQGRSSNLGGSIGPGTWFLTLMLMLLGEAYVIEY